MRNKSSNNEMVRITQIDKLSYSVFGHLAPDELDSLEREFEFATTRMLQVVEIKSKHILVMDLHEDLTFKPVFLPDNIMHLLRRGDTLLGSIGLKASSWHLFYMSPLYY